MSDALNILVVEDDDALRDALAITLETAGHRVSAVDGGPAALNALKIVKKDIAEIKIVCSGAGRTMNCRHIWKGRTAFGLAQSRYSTSVSFV